MRLLSTFGLGLMVYVTAAVAGIEGGNTQLFRLKNSKGEMINISFSNKHPLHETILNKIQAAKLPAQLKREMLSDLQNTAIRYSSETITYEETQQQLLMRLKSLKTKDVTRNDGSTETTVEREYEPSKVESELGIYIHGVNIVATDLKKSYVAAYTQSNPSAVVYFTSFVDQMNESEKTILVLHEQAHRLEYLKRYRDDERFITAWAESLYAYLKGEMTDEDFFRILKSHQLPMHSNSHIDGETIVLDPKDGTISFDANLFVTVRPEDIMYSGIYNGKYVFQLKSSVFKNYPELEQMGMVRIALSESITDNVYQYVSRLFGNGTPHMAPMPMQLRVRYKKEQQADSTGQIYTTLKLLDNPKFAPKRLIDSLSAQFQEILGRHGLFRNIGIETNVLLLDPSNALKLLQLAERISTLLDNFEHEHPEAYADLRNLYQTLTLSEATETHQPVFFAGSDTRIALAVSEQDLTSQVSDHELKTLLQFRVGQLNVAMQNTMSRHAFVKRIALRPNEDQTTYHWTQLSALDRPDVQTHLLKMAEKIARTLSTIRKDDSRKYRYIKSRVDSIAVNIHRTERGHGLDSKTLILNPFHANGDLRPLTEKEITTLLAGTDEDLHKHLIEKYQEWTKKHYGYDELPVQILMSGGWDEPMSRVAYQVAKSAVFHRQLVCMGQNLKNKSWWSKANVNLAKTIEISFRFNSTGNELAWSADGADGYNDTRWELIIFVPPFLVFEQPGVLRGFLNDLITNPSAYFKRSSEKESGRATWNRDQGGIQIREKDQISKDSFEWFESLATSCAPASPRKPGQGRKGD